ncbi:MAG: hypothetical protein FJ026_11730 [Chloroflexi bacterium]|nr:hypothetical protein [Chloroflexota bacterium]
MRRRRPRGLLHQPVFQVLATWTWNFFGTPAVALAVAWLLPANIALDRAAMRAHPAWAMIPVLSQIVLVGLLPVLFTRFNRERAVRYGLTYKRLGASLVLSALVVLAYFAFLSLWAGRLTTSVTLPGWRQATPLNVLRALLALFAYGPLEVFFVVWLIHNTDRIFKTERALLSPGLLVTIGAYGFLHTFSQGLYAFVIAAEFLALGLVYKRTRNAVGPMLAFLLMNEYAWFLARVFLP